MSPTHSPKQAGWAPVPWTVTDNRRLNGAFWITTRHPEGWQVSLAEVRNGCDEADEIGDVEAHAHLIATAPELYEALDHPLLREVLGFVEDAAPDEVMAKLRLWQDEQRTALSKARPSKGEA